MTDDLSRIHYRPDLYDTDEDSWAAQAEEERAAVLSFCLLVGTFLAACVAAVGFAVGLWNF